MSDNPFKAIVEMYESAVKEADEKGYSDLFKECTEAFFKFLNMRLNPDTSSLHITDVEYLDGYFIFAHGTNSVIHFHIAECPGWKFGIWWNEPKNDEGHRYVPGSFFAQYEEIIDKFKPSRSQFCREFQISLYDCERQDGFCLWEVASDIQFIKNEPYLAFCRDYHGWDYNIEFHSREEAEEEYHKYRKAADDKREYTQRFDREILEFVEQRVVPCFVNAKVVDSGENVSPRYDVVAPFESNRDLVDEPGCYDWFADDDKEGAQIEKEFDAMVKERKELADKNGFYYFSPISKVIFFNQTKKSKE